MEIQVEIVEGVNVIECSGLAGRDGSRLLSTELDGRIRKREKKFIVDLSAVDMAGRDMAAALSTSCTRLRGHETRMVIVTGDAGLRQTLEKLGVTRLAYVCKTRQEAEVELGLQSLA